MSEVVPEKILYCDFCGKNNNEVAKLIAGPKCFICDECIVLCMTILGEHYRQAFSRNAPLPITTDGS